MNKLTYCVKERKKTGNKEIKIEKTKNNRYIMKSICVDCNSKKTTFVSKQEGEGLLSMLGINSGPTKNIPLLGPLLG